MCCHEDTVSWAQQLLTQKGVLVNQQLLNSQMALWLVCEWNSKIQKQGNEVGHGQNHSEGYQEAAHQYSGMSDEGGPLALIDFLCPTATN
jgi:hypothetical protein